MNDLEAQLGCDVDPRKTHQHDPGTGRGRIGPAERRGIDDRSASLAVLASLAASLVAASSLIAPPSLPVEGTVAQPVVTAR